MSTRRPLTPADVLSFKNIEDPQISPAGDCVAFVSGDSFKAGGSLPASAIWVVDVARLAIAGWSYGGFAAAWAVAQTDRFKAAVMGAGISHWLSFHGKTCLATWDQLFYQAKPI